MTMPITGEDTLQGFLVGTVNESGRCEACDKRLGVGSRAALWHPTRELFCLECAESVWRGKRSIGEVLTLPVIAIVVLFASVVLGILD